MKSKQMQLYDKLEIMFDMQKKLQKQLGYNFIAFDNNYFNLMFIGCITELSEVIENTMWKPWKLSSRNNIIKTQEELIDVFHFLINMCIACNLSPEELFEKFIKKNNENMERNKHGY